MEQLQAKQIEGTPKGKSLGTPAYIVLGCMKDSQLVMIV